MNLWSSVQAASFFSRAKWRTSGVEEGMVQAHKHRDEAHCQQRRPVVQGHLQAAAAPALMPSAMDICIWQWMGLQCSEKTLQWRRLLL